MHKLVESGRRDMTVRSLAGNIIAGCGQKNWRCYAQKLFDWVRKHITYIYDPQDVEMVIHPKITIKAKAGDCDDQVVLLAALAESIGLNTAFVTIKAVPDSDEFTHVYLYIFMPGSNTPIAADTTMPYGLGWEPPRNMPRRVWRRADKMGTLSGLGRLGNYSLTDILYGVIDGSLRQKLRDANTALNLQTRQLNAFASKLKAVTNTAEQNRLLAILRKARESVAAAREIVNQAVYKYNFIAGEARRVGFSTPDVGLSSLGIGPAIPTAWLITGGVIATTALALSVLVGQISGAVHGGDGYINQLANAFQASGVVIEKTADSTVKVAGVALVLGAAYVAWTLLKKRGYA